MANETWYGEKAKPVDPGGARPGQPKIAREETTESYECLRCDTTQIEQKSARHRAKRICCRQCGNTVYPVTVAPEKTQSTAKFCKKCQAKLRRGNSSMLCSLCDR
jgi:hypothetical protein